MTIKELLKIAQEAVQEGFGDMPLVLETASENGDTVDSIEFEENPFKTNSAVIRIF